VPRAVTAVMHTTMISASITAYSTAVGPLSSFTNDDCVDGCTECRIEDHPRRRHSRWRCVANRERWIVGKDRTHTDGDCVSSRTQIVHLSTRRLTCQPSRLARRIGDGTIRRQRQLERDPWSVAAVRMKERRVKLDRRLTFHADVDRYAGVPESFDSATSNGAWVPHRGDHTSNLGADESINAGRRFPEVSAWLEGDDSRRAAGARSRGSQCDDFGVRRAVSSVKAFGNNLVVACDDGADHWVRRRLSPTPSRETERASHQGCVIHHQDRRSPREPYRRDATTPFPSKLLKISGALPPDTCPISPTSFRSGKFTDRSTKPEVRVIDCSKRTVFEVWPPNVPFAVAVDL